MRSFLLTLALALASGCYAYPQATYSAASSPSYATPSGTAVFINGQELTVEQKTELDALIGAIVPPGRYFVDAQGNAGLEGQAATVNLVELARARQTRTARTPSRSTEIHSTDSSGYHSSMVSDGNCILVSTPGADFASSGC
jgi:hypothetical protein